MNLINIAQQRDATIARSVPFSKDEVLPWFGPRCPDVASGFPIFCEVWAQFDRDGFVVIVDRAR